MHTLPEPDPKISEMLVKAHRKARNVLTALPKVESGWTIACQAFHAMPGCESEMNQYPREDFFTEAAAGDDFVGVQAYLRTFIGKDVRCQLLMRWNVPLQVGNTSLRLSA